MEEIDIVEIEAIVKKHFVKMNQVRKASTKYYNKKFIISDDMSDEEKQKVQERRDKRNKYYKDRYNKMKNIKSIQTD